MARTPDSVPAPTSITPATLAPTSPVTAGDAIDPADPATVLLFDLDGTVTDSLPGIASCFRRTLAELGLPSPNPADARAVAGPPLLDTFRRLGLDVAAADRALDIYRRHYGHDGWRNNSVFAGMSSLLDDLYAGGRTLAIATSKNQAMAQRILEHFGLAHHFATIAGASEDSARRHKPDVIAHALSTLGVAPSRCVMIGDRRHDIDGARRFAIPTVMVGWGYALDGEIDSAHWSVDSVSDLRELLGV